MQKNLKILPAAAVIAAASAVVLRVFQLLIAVNYSEMGFFSTEAGFLPANGLYILFVLAAAVFIIAAIFDKKHGAAAFTKNAQSLTPKHTTALGAAFLIGACLHFSEIAFGFNGITLGFIGQAVVFVLFAVIGFLLLGGRSVKPVIGYLQIIICISYTIKAASLFMQDTIIVRVSDELILLLSYVSSVLFFLALGRFITSNESKLTRYKLLIFAAASAVLSACVSVAGYIAFAVDPAYMGQHMTMHPVCEFSVTVIAFVSLAVLYSRKSAEVSKADDEAEKSEADESNENA